METRRSARTILFLCTGNYYRSRFAEILFNSVAAKMRLPWRALSRGLALERGGNNVGPMAPSAIVALEELGIRADEAILRFPAPLLIEDLQRADRVVALKRDEHLPLLRERWPEWAENVEFWHVDDAPKVLGLIEREVMALVARILGGGERQPATAVQSTDSDLLVPKVTAKKPIAVKVGRETAGRRGKGVTTVFDVPLNESGLKELAATLKQRCGTGGTVKDGRIEIQGDQRERLVIELEKLGYKARRVGG